MYYLHKVNLYLVVGVNQCRRNSASPEYEDENYYPIGISIHSN